MELERIALEDEYFISRKLYPNVDFYSGIIYQAMGFPVDMFPVLFAIRRMSGLAVAVGGNAHRHRAEDRPAAPDLHRQGQASLRAHRGPGRPRGRRGGPLGSEAGGEPRHVPERPVARNAAGRSLRRENPLSGLRGPGPGSENDGAAASSRGAVVLAAGIGAVTAIGAAARPACAAGPVPETPMLKVPYTQFTLPNGLHVILHEDHTVPMVTVEHVVPRRLGARDAGAHRLRAPLRAPDVHGLGPREARASSTTGSKAVGGTQQRLDRRTTAPTTGSTCRPTRSSSRCSSSPIAWATCSTSMTPKTVDAQRDVVKNERRQSYENRPYGMAELAARRDALSRRPSVLTGRSSATCRTSRPPSYDDVVAFFKKYYAPANASLVVAGDIDTADDAHARREMVRRREAGAPRVEPMTIPGVALDGREEEDDRPTTCSCRGSTSRG